MLIVSCLSTTFYNVRSSSLAQSPMYLLFPCDFSFVIAPRCEPSMRRYSPTLTMSYRAVLSDTIFRVPFFLCQELSAESGVQRRRAIARTRRWRPLAARCVPTVYVCVRATSSSLMPMSLRPTESTVCLLSGPLPTARLHRRVFVLVPLPPPRLARFPSSWRLGRPLMLFSLPGRRRGAARSAPDTRDARLAAESP